MNYIVDQKEKWQGIKGMKNDRIPHFIHMKDMHGNFVAPKDRGDTIAKCWKKSIGITQTQSSVGTGAAAPA